MAILLVIIFYALLFHFMAAHWKIILYIGLAIFLISLIFTIISAGGGFFLACVLISIITIIAISTYESPESRIARERQVKNIKIKEQKRIDDVKAKEQKRIDDIMGSNTVFIASRKLHAIPLRVSGEELVLLHPILAYVHYSPKPTIRFSEINTLVDDININCKNTVDFYTIDQISSIARDLYLNIDPQNRELKIKLDELKKLESLARYSELYKQQADLYLRAGNQIKDLLDRGTKLSQECNAFIFDILIGQELGKYNPDDIPDVLEIRISLDSRCQQVFEQYQFLKSEMDEYMNLKNGN